MTEFSASSIKLEGEQLAALVGHYQSSETPLDICLFFENLQLMAQATGQGAFPLSSFSGSEFRFDQAGIVMLFGREASPMTFRLEKGGRRFSLTRDAE